MHATRLKSIMLLNSPIILKIIPTLLQLFSQKAALFSKTHANIVIKHKQLYLVTNKYLK